MGGCGVIDPPSEVIASRRYWYADVLEAADRRRTVEAGNKAAAANHPTP